MSNVSQRLRTLNDGGSDGWEVFYRARAMVADGMGVTELTIGEHDIKTDPAILDAMDRSARSGHTGYAMVPGVHALRDAVAARVQERTGQSTSRDNVLITPGGQAALFSAHMLACDPGQTALYLDPFYATYPGTLRAAGALPHAIATQPEENFQPTDRDLAEAPPAASLLVNSPNNPTGVVYSAQTWNRLTRFAQDRDLWLISDEVYDSQVWEGRHISPRSLPDMAERTLVVGSMSKTFAMTGSRIGWLVGPEDAIAAAIDLATTTTYGVPGFVQDAALWALQSGDDLETRVAEPFRRRRDLVVDAVEACQSIALIPAQGAMYAMLDVRKTGLSGAEFANRLLDTHLIAVMPGESFGTSAAGHIRVALTADDPALAVALRRICAFADEIAAVTAA